MKKKPLTIAMMARKGGLSRSTFKTEAARRNGLLGGRSKWKSKPVIKESLTTETVDEELI